jgi:small basic protein (TIGR04137 family)
MSIHPSLSTSAKNKKVRSVLKRAERLKMMLGKGTWKKGEKIFALPKIKTTRIKIKKEKAAPAATAVTPEAGANMPSAKKESSESPRDKESKK